jgi:hypothetical protein
MEMENTKMAASKGKASAKEKHTGHKGGKKVPAMKQSKKMVGKTKGNPGTKLFGGGK